MKFQRVKIAYYSGTGGTKRIAESFARKFECLGADVDVQTILSGVETGQTHQTCQTDQKEYDLMMVLYPVYAFRGPEPVYRWIDGLGPGKKTPTVVISVSGGGEVWPNKACRRKAIANLEAKGFKVVHESMAVMPSNIAVPTTSPADRLLVELIPHFVEGVTNDLTRDRFRRTRPDFWNRFMASVGNVEKYGAHFFGKRIRVGDSCTGCGLCADCCPSGNIAIKEGHPIFDGKCFLCMKCFYGCPSNALRPGIGKFAVLKGGYDLDKGPQRESLIPMTKEQLEKLIPGMIWSGVRKYILEIQGNASMK